MSPENLMPPSAISGNSGAAGRPGALADCVDLRHAGAGDDPRGADRARPDADLDGVGAALQEVAGARLGGDVAGDDRGRGEALANELQRVEHALAVPVGRVEDEDVHLGPHELAGAVQDVPGDADRPADPQAPESVLGRVRVLDRLLDVLDGDQALEVPGAVHHEELLDAVLVQKLLGLLERRADGCGDEVLLRHPRRDRAVGPRLEAQVPVGQNPDELAAVVDDGHARDLVASHDLQRLGDGLLGPAGDRVDDHARFGALDLVHLGRLGLDREVLVDDPEASLLGHGDGQARLGHGVHRGRDERDVEADLAGQAGAQVHVARVHLGVGGHQQDVVERQGERNVRVGTRALAFVSHQAPAAPWVAPWHFLYFRPEPQGHGSLRPTLGALRWIVSTFASWPPEAAAP